jgi:hypothetical protein
VQTNTYAYYSFTLINNAPLSISVTPYSGDPDLFVSTTTTTPSFGNYQW